MLLEIQVVFLKMEDNSGEANLTVNQHVGIILTSLQLSRFNFPEINFLMCPTVAYDEHFKYFLFSGCK